MMRCAVIALMVGPSFASADAAMDTQRALIERDRQSEEFARPELRDFHLRRDQQHLPVRPDERAHEAHDRGATLLREPQRVAPAPDYRPLPLPGGPGHGVDPIPVPGAGG